MTIILEAEGRSVERIELSSVKFGVQALYHEAHALAVL